MLSMLDREVAAGGPPGAGREPATLVALLRRRAEREPGRRAYSFLGDGEEVSSELTFGELDRRARAVARGLVGRGAAGKPVMLLYPAGLDFIVGFFGCLYARALAVTAYPPANPRHLGRLQAIVADTRAELALTTRRGAAQIRALGSGTEGLGALELLATDEVPAGLEAEVAPELRPRGDDLAYLQYTSGSIAAPKGVMVSHSNLLANLENLDAGWRHTPRSILVSWLPTFHDMGLIYGVLQPLYGGFHGILMAPSAFVMKPRRWLQAISRFHATHSIGPNFAYDLCVERISPEQRDALDLRSWEVAVNGAEPIRWRTLERFAEYFSPAGFRRSALCPGYGLAEATLKVTALRWDEELVTHSVAAEALRRNRLVPSAAASAASVTLVSCGRPQLDVEVAIVDPQTRTPRGPDEIGEIWVRGNSVTAGYWNRPDETREVFAGSLSTTGGGPYLRTGDLGFLHAGHLYVTGRRKDLLIFGGRNHYPQDVELTVADAHPVIRSGSVAAFAVDGEGGERLVVAAELEPWARHRPVDLAAVDRRIRRAVAEGHEVRVAEVVFLQPRTLPKTSSGKIRRAACREAFLAGRLAVWTPTARASAGATIR